MTPPPGILRRLLTFSLQEYAIEHCDEDACHVPHLGSRSGGETL
jgi:hypothetical protein